MSGGATDRACGVIVGKRSRTPSAIVRDELCAVPDRPTNQFVRRTICCRARPATRRGKVACRRAPAAPLQAVEFEMAGVGQRLNHESMEGEDDPSSLAGAAGAAVKNALGCARGPSRGASVASANQAGTISPASTTGAAVARDRPSPITAGSGRRAITTVARTFRMRRITTSGHCERNAAMRPTR